MSDERIINILKADGDEPEVKDLVPGAGGSDNPAQMEIPKELPVLPVRDIVVFNYMILPLFVGREKSVNAVDAALNTSRFILVLTQKDEKVDEPGEADLHRVGTVGMIMRMLKMPDGRLKVLVQGLSRARVTRFIEGDKHHIAQVELLEEKTPAEPGPAVEALMRAAREQTEKIMQLRGISSPDITAVLTSVDEPGRLADLIAANLRIKVEEAQSLLETDDAVKRLEVVNGLLIKEVEVASMQAKIQSMAKEGMDKAQKDYFLREQMKAIRRELGETGDESEEIEEVRKAIAKAGMPEEVRTEAEKQLRRLESMHAESSEASVIRTYLDWMTELPWKKLSKDRLDIKEAENILEADHYGLEKVKERILEYLSVRKLNPKMKGPILCFVGPPGVGKTSLGRSIARSLGRKFVRMSLGGMRDEAEIRGHRRTYIGAMPGRLIQSIKQAGTRNPVIMLDEIDKLGADFRGDPSSALLEVLDPEQNHTFQDHYLNVPFDLSKVMFVCTANMLDTIPGPLRDRMEIIRIPGYTENDKVKIATTYIVPRQAKENGLDPAELKLGEPVLRKLIKEYTREAGLRNLEREVGSVCRKLARQKAEGAKGPFKVSTGMLHKLLGIPPYREEARDAELPAGVANGLAWTPFGGDILHIEVQAMPGKGKLTITGQLGDVMKESAQAAISFARGRAKDMGIDPEFTEKTDIHIHVPAGATPKDGPSAGVTMVTALISALTGVPVCADLAMTGEITLRGRVLPVGGIKEKILAAVSSGIKQVLIPKDNEKDLQDVPVELRHKIVITPIDRIDEIWPIACKPEPAARTKRGRKKKARPEAAA